MAKQTVTREVEILLCDICVSAGEEVEAIETVVVETARGSRFQNDVCETHRDVLRQGRRFTRPGHNGTGNGTVAASAPRRRIKLPPVREWAAEQGIEVAARGKVPKAVVEQYDEARKG